MSPPPLAGTRIVEFSAIGPVPLAGMLLADLGADVVRVERPERGELDVIPADRRDPVLRGRRTVCPDLTDPVVNGHVRQLIDRADVLLEGSRPGAMERLGIGPDVCCTNNSALIYARMTGWGQSGPLARTAGHDINYIAATGALHALGRRDEPPVVPLNLLGDYGAGATFLVMGILAALVERTSSGLGQVIDAAMIDGVATLLQPVNSWRAAGLWSDDRESNLLDGAAPYYRTYRCADGRYVAVGAIESRFYAVLVTGMGLATGDLPDRLDRSAWPILRDVFAARFATRTRDDWAAAFGDTDACVTPVLTFEEAAGHPQLRTRGTLHHRHGQLESAPAPRFSRSSPGPGGTAVPAELDEVLRGWPARH